MTYARWNSTLCRIYSFYDNSLFSVGEIILTLIQSAPEIPKLLIFAAGYYVPHCQKPLQSLGKQRLPVCPHPRPLTIDGVTELTE